MIDFKGLLDLQIQIFIFILLGYILYKMAIVDAKARKSITDLVIYVVLPCNIICSFMMKLDMKILKAGLTIFVVSLLIQALCVVLGRFMYTKTKKEERKVLKYGTICSNAGFMGNPVIEGIYGSQGLFLASIYLIPLRIMMWSSGVACFTNANRRDVIRKVLTHPCIIAVIIGLVLFLFQIQLPTSINKGLQSISYCTTFLSMLIIGGILAEINFKSVISKLSIYYSAIRLLIIPALVLGGCLLFKMPYLVTATSCVLAGMPAGTTTAILAQKYQGDEHLAVKLIFLSTILSLFTIPLWVYIIEMFF